MFETNKENFSGSKPIIGRRITFNPEEIGAFGLEQFFHILNINILYIKVREYLCNWTPNNVEKICINLHLVLLLKYQSEIKLNSDIVFQKLNSYFRNFGLYNMTHISKKIKNICVLFRIGY